MKGKNLIRLILITTLSSDQIPDDKTVVHYLDEANEFLKTGKYQNVIDSFNNAINLEPDNFITYFKRANVYVTLGKTNSAIKDFTKIIELKPDYEKALFHRAKLNLKLGHYKETLDDLRKITDESLKTDSQLLQVQAMEIKKTMPHIRVKIENKRHSEANELLTGLLTISPHSAYLLTMRAKVQLVVGLFDEAVRDLTKISQLDPMDEDTIYNLAVLNYFVNYAPELAMKNVKLLLHYDPENPKFTKLFKRFKKMDRQVVEIEKMAKDKKWNPILDSLEPLFVDIDVAVAGLISDLGTTAKVTSKLKGALSTYACQAHSRLKHKNNIISSCTDAIEFDDHDYKAFLARSEGYLILEEYESAVNDLNNANKLSSGQNTIIKEKLKTAQKLLKQSKQKDYYKILNVSRDATDKEIKKQFKKLAREWHPDKYAGDLTSEQVLNKMSDINLAYEVLSNEESRQKFDNGVDPNDPMADQHGGHGFHQGGFHQGGGHPFEHFFGGGGGETFHFEF